MVAEVDIPGKFSFRVHTTTRRRLEREQRSEASKEGQEAGTDRITTLGGSNHVGSVRHWLALDHHLLHRPHRAIDRNIGRLERPRRFHSHQLGLRSFHSMEVAKQITFM